MFRNNISVYVRTEEIAQKVRAYAQKLNQEQGARPYIKSTPEPFKPAQADSYQDKKTELPKPYEIQPLPMFLTDIMNGGTFPAPEDLTRAEQAILYDNQINTLVNLYRQTKKADLAQHIRERLDEIGVDF